MKKTVAVLFGGRGCEHGISCATAHSLLSLLDEERYLPLPVGIARDGGFFLTDAPPPAGKDFVPREGIDRPAFPVRLADKSGFLSDGEILKVDVVLPALHGDYGEDGQIQGLLSSAALPYVGSDTAAGALCADKALTKTVAAHLGIPTLPWLLFSGEESRGELLSRLSEAFPTENGFPPLFLKPACLGSSVGASPALDESAFFSAFEKAARHGKVLVEPYLSPIWELEVAALLTGPAPILSGPAALRSGCGFYSYREKYEADTAEILLSPPLPQATRATVLRFAERLLSALACRDLARVDFFLDSGGSLYFNEINTFPGFTDISLYPRLMAEAGIPPRELLTRLLEAALARRV